MTNRKTAIVVSGMHRSGTSSVAGVVSLLGATLPGQLLPPRPDNPRGFFESAPIVDLNDRILAAAHTSWEDWRSLNDQWSRHPQFEEFLGKAVELLAKEFGDAQLIVLKDPRICKLLPFWTRALEKSGFAACHIIPVRHPAEVTESLVRRNSLPRVLVRLLWARYLVDAELHTRALPRIFLPWDALLQDPLRSMGQIAARLSIEWPISGERARVLIAEFLSAELRHYRQAPEVPAPHAVADYADRTYAALQLLVRNPVAPRALKMMDAVRADYSGAEQSFGPLLADMEAARGEIDGELSRHRQALGERIDELIRQHAVLEEMGRNAATTTAQLQATNEERERLVAELSDRTAERDRVTLELAGAVRDRDSARLRLSAVTTELFQTGQRLQDTVQERDAAARVVQEKVAQLHDTGLQLEDARQRSRSAEERLESLRNMNFGARLRSLFRNDGQIYRSACQDQQVEAMKPRWSVNAQNPSPPSGLLALRDLMQMNGAAFVIAAYGRLLKRVPDDGGLSHYLSRLLDGTPKIMLLAEISRSGEAREAGTHLSGLATAAWLFRVSRIPVLGLAARVAFGTDGMSAVERRLRAIDQRLQGGSDVAAMAARASQPVARRIEDEALDDDALPVPASLEALLRLHGRQFLQGAYRALLLREPDPSGTRFYLTRLRDGIPKLQILAELAGSREARGQGTSLPGLPRALFAYRLGRLPLLGPVWRLFSGVEGNTAVEKRLRAMEQELHDPAAPAEPGVPQTAAVATPAPVIHRWAPQEDPTGLRGLVAESGLFDAQWYLAQPPALDADVDALGHYLDQGWREGRAPSARFSGDQYLRWYPDARQSGLNPLVHYLQGGRKEGRRHVSVAEAQRLGFFKPPAVTDDRIACLKEVTVAGEMAVCVTHAPDGRVKPHVVHYVASLRRNGIGVVLVIMAGSPVAPLSDDLAEMLSGAYVRQNRGYDFAAWAHVLQLYPALFAAPILYLVNDSMFGPLNDTRFAALLARIRSALADVVALTDSEEHQWHLQSYFLACKATGLSRAEFHRFINDIRSLADKDDVIRNYELKFGQTLRDRGLKVEVLFPAPAATGDGDRHNRTLFDWKTLIEEGFPFVKVGALRRDHPLIDITDWQRIVRAEGYDPELVEETLRRAPKLAGDASVVPEPPGMDLVQATVIAARRVAQLRIALIGPWNFDSGEGSTVRGTMAALWHTGVELNVHPVGVPFQRHRQSAPPLDCRSFSGDADLVIVQLNPDLWPTLLSDEQRSVIARAGKVAGAWHWETQNIPDSWYPGFESVDAIWAPSNYCADTFRRVARVPVTVVPACIAPPPPPDCAAVDGLRRDLGIEPGQRLILCCFKGEGSLMRHNPAAVVAAFGRSGLAGDGWRLVMKTRDLSATDPGSPALRQLIATTPGVILVDQYYASGRMGALLDAADIVVSAHRASSVRMTLMEAMARGKICVATDFGGCRDFLDPACGYVVPCRPDALAQDHGPYLQGSLWAEIDPRAFTAALQAAAQRGSHGENQTLGQVARQRISARHSPQAIAAALTAAATALVSE